MAPKQPASFVPGHSDREYNRLRSERSHVHHELDRISSMTGAIAVQDVLRHTGAILSTPAGVEAVENPEVRVGKFLGKVLRSQEGSQETTTQEQQHTTSSEGAADENSKRSRLLKLRQLDPASLIFIALSFRSLEVYRLPNSQFDYLLHSTPRCVRGMKLPESWLFQKPIQLALANRVDNENMLAIRSAYHMLEFQASAATATAPTAPAYPAPSAHPASAYPASAYPAPLA
ncbi:hypothetical protein B0H66DRAFT_592743, partial [Apodospora peruviana]